MVMPLETPVSELGRIGARCAGPLRTMGVRTVGDLLRHYPFRYDDLSRLSKLSGPTDGPVTVRARLDLIKSWRSPRKKVLLTEATVSDDLGSAKVVWFGRPFIAKILKPGDKLLLSGRLESRPWGLEMSNPAYEKETGASPIHTGRLVPIYPLSGPLTSKQVRALLHSALPSIELVEETLDAPFLAAHGLMGVREALRKVHFPADEAEAEAAGRRLRFEELLSFQLRGALARRTLKEREACAVPFDEAAARRFVAGLPFQLTGDQKKVAWRILQDMSSGRPMNRLVEGDVGSGKTVVAALVMNNCAEAGFSSLLMAPTEILAMQHYRTVAKLLRDCPVPVALVTRSELRLNGTGGERQVTRRQFLKELSTRPSVLVGTHAILNENLRQQRLGLAIVDEQHRFGVLQRHRLISGLRAGDGPVPHFLSMTATPIPRSLALALYGDLDFSALRELPKGRLPVRTLLVRENDRPKMYAEIRREIAAGRKAFVVCPLIEPSDSFGVRSAEEEAERLRREAFPDAEVGLLHGKMRGSAKEETMSAFSKGNVSVLVSTTVVEVGVDVPLATVMVIEGAERFGLAQLHQLRGRVGRNDLPSTCYLASSSDNPGPGERLEAFIRARDCFELAELDLKFRGPGELYGEEQSGRGEMKLFRPEDIGLIEETKRAATELLKDDPDLEKHPLLKETVSSVGEKVHLE